MTRRRAVALTILAALVSLGCITIPWPKPTPPPPPTTTTTTTTTLPQTGPPEQPLPASCLPDASGWTQANSAPEAVDLAEGATAVVHAEHPELFVEDGQTLADASPAGVERYYDELGLALRAGKVGARKVCAGQPREGGALVDKFGVMLPSGAMAQFHLVEYGGFRLQRPIRMNSKWRPPDEPSPTPTASPAAACPSPLPPLDKFAEIGIKRHTMGYCDTSEIIARACDYCASIGMGEMGGVIRCSCPVRPDGHRDRVACEATLGELRWEADAGELEMKPDEEHPGTFNTSMARCVQDSGCTRVRKCRGAICSEWCP